MAAWLTNVLHHLLPHHCIDEFFVKFNYYHVQCLKITLSKILGIGIILGSILVKVPQIIKLVRAKSGEGISIYGLIFELLAIVATMAYSLAYEFPFSAWGEGFFLLIQTTIIALLVLYYEFSLLPLILFASIYSSVLFYLLGGLAPIEVLSMMQATNVPIIVIAKFFF
uniref:Mannose-P-dolichol utilization defect 1 protein homolog n=1 Tax=Strigamia maritima TaxID=126957 RepID=T1J718_STRMM